MLSSGRLYCRGPGQTQAVYASVTGRKKVLLVGLDKKQTWMQLEP